MSDEQIVWKLIQYWGCVSCYFIKRLSETELFHHSDLGAWQNTKIFMGVERWGATDAKCIGLEWSNDIQWHDSDEGEESEARLGTFQYWMMTRLMGTSSGKAIGTDLCMKHAEIVAWAKMLSCASLSPCFSWWLWNVWWLIFPIRSIISPAWAYQGCPPSNLQCSVFTGMVASVFLVWIIGNSIPFVHMNATTAHSHDSQDPCVHF
jgi:hypothetical protein